MTRKIGGAELGGTDLHVISVTPVLTNSTDNDYASGDFVGTSLTVMTFAGVVDSNGRSGIVEGCTLVDATTTAVAGELWLFDTLFTPSTSDSVAWTVTDAIMETCIGIVPFATYYSSAANCTANGVPATPLHFKCGASVNDLYGVFVTRGTPDYAIDSLTFRLRTRET